MNRVFTRIRSYVKLLTNSVKMGKVQYPSPRRDDSVIDEYHGNKIADPYQWLEDPDSEETKQFVDAQNAIADPYQWLEDPDSEETKQFVDAQNAVSKPFIEACPVRQQLKERITEMWDYPKFSCPSKKGKHYYYSYNTGLQNQSVVFTQETLDGESKVFVDPNTFSEDGTTSISSRAFSENGEIYAYGLSESGSDWITVKFKKAPSGEDLPDILMRVKFSSLAWTHDHKGIFYNSYPEQEGKSDGTETTSNLHQKLYYHVMGTEQSADVLVAEFPDHPKWMIGAEVSDCGRYLILTPREGCDPVNRLFYTDLQTLPDGINGILPYVKVVDNFDAEYEFFVRHVKTRTYLERVLYSTDLQTLPDGINGILPYVKVVDNFDAEYEYITNEGTVFTFKTNLKSPNYKLINIDFSNYEMSNWKTLVEEHEKNVLEWTGCVRNDRLVLCYLQDVKNQLYVHDLSSGKQLVNLPLEVGTIVGFSGKKDQTEIFYQFMSFLTPGIIYRCDMSDDSFKPVVYKDIKVKNFDFTKFTTEQVFYSSKDGTKVPMFIIHKKDLALDSSNPVMLYGYGGFNIPISPTFSVSRLVFLQNLGGVYAVANIRGGGEYGETWHKGGMLGNKQNVFDDFQAAAEYLVEKKYTCKSRITINGGSNGGLLVGACLNQRPDLFGCGIAQVGVMDMLKFHKFTIGHAWTTDFGCSEKEEQFQWLIKYSPLHNIKVPEDAGTQYPSVLLLTADHDDRVVPLHSLKYIAQLQYEVGPSDKQTNPLMIRVDTKAGHGAGKPTAKVIEDITDIYSFMYQCLGLKWIEPSQGKL